MSRPTTHASEEHSDPKAIPGRAFGRPAARTDSDADRQERFRSLYHAHLDAVVGYALRRSTRAAADDVVAETFLTAWTRLGDVPSDPHQERAWLIGVARRKLSNWSRSERRRLALTSRLAAEPVYPPDGPPDQSLDPDLATALASLNPKDRELVCLLAWDKLDRPQAARVLECSPVALRLKLFRIRRQLAAALEAPQASPRSTEDNK